MKLTLCLPSVWGGACGVQGGSPKGRKLTLSREWLQKEGGARQRPLQRVGVERALSQEGGGLLQDKQKTDLDGQG